MDDQNDLYPYSGRYYTVLILTRPLYQMLYLCLDLSLIYCENCEDCSDSMKSSGATQMYFNDG